MVNINILKIQNIDFDYIMVYFFNILNFIKLKPQYLIFNILKNKIHYAIIIVRWCNYE